ncbi:MAG: hypothetical protein OXI80_00130 [Caldilineaceae bacterium]|nr:hypothetical protein [Caldilineaceae bacterium]MDE0336048.1 hypothetical protein [Caldilineaceae bacterium]
MKLHQIPTVALTLSLLLTSCVPISPVPPTPDLAAEIKTGYSDLAIGLARIDQSNDIQRYVQVLNEFADCMQVLRNEEANMDLSDSELVALTIYYAGVFSMVQVFVLETENSPASNDGKISSSIYDQLKITLSTCEE